MEATGPRLTACMRAISPVAVSLVLIRAVPESPVVASAGLELDVNTSKGTGRLERPTVSRAVPATLGSRLEFFPGWFSRANSLWVSPPSRNSISSHC